MHALVTGANGFIGSSLVEKLLREKWKIRCFVRKTSNLRWLSGLDIDLIFGSIFDSVSLNNAVKDVDVVFHLAGVTKGKTQQDYDSGNYVATINLLQACRERAGSSPKFVFVSSQAAGGPSLDGRALSEAEAIYPISAYGRSKRKAEQAVLEFSRLSPATIIRPPSVFGPRDADFLMLHKAAKKGVIPIPGGGRQKISIVYISDLVDGLAAAAANERADGEIFFISQDQAITFYELGQIVAKVWKNKTIMLPVPLWLVQGASFFAAGMSKISGKPALLNADKVLEMKQPAWVCSNAKAKKVLNFTAKIDIEEGMKITARWYEKMGWL